jgi:hypothetical protein
MTSRERIIELVNQITAARAHLQTLEGELDQLLPRGPGRPRLTPGAARHQGTLAARVIQLLESEPSQTFGMAEVATRLDRPNMDSLRKTVLRLVAQRKIQRERRGIYRAVRRRGRPKTARG